MKPILLCLHGWGGSKESFTELREALKGTDVEILTPDLPGFGLEPEPAHAWTVDDYANWVEHWLHKALKNKNDERKTLHILGHSHGGRIAMKLALRGKMRISHLYLCAPAGIRHARHLKRIAGLILAKGGKIFLAIPGLKKLQPIGRKLLYRLVRVHDYEKASPIMRETLLRVTQEDFRPYLSKIRVPTDIFWGEEDRMTPLKDGFLMQEHIKNSTLHTYKGVRHRIHRERAKEIAVVIRAKIALP